MIGMTKGNTIHGNPGERRMLPIATRVQLIPANNLPADSKIKYWAHPLPEHPWPKETDQWAEDVGVGLHDEDVLVLE